MPFPKLSRAEIATTGMHSTSPVVDRYALNKGQSSLQEPASPTPIGADLNNPTGKKRKRRRGEVFRSRTGGNARSPPGRSGLPE